MSKKRKRRKSFKHEKGQGSNTRYCYGCRCRECKDAHAASLNDYYHRVGKFTRKPHYKYKYMGEQSKRAALYTPVRAAEMPAGIIWRRQQGTSPQMARTVRVEYSVGKTYKRVTDIATGNQIFYRLLVAEYEMKQTPEQIDAEPDLTNPATMNGRRRYLLGTHAWFVDTDSKWYLVVVCARTPHRMTIRPVTGRDADRLKDWPYGDELEFPSSSVNRIFQRLRPLELRKA